MSEENVYQRELEREQSRSPINSETEGFEGEQQLNSKLADASGFQSGISRFEFTPDDENPDFRFVLWLRTRALKASDQGLIQNRVNQLRIDSATLERLQSQLARLKPDHRIERNEQTLNEMSIDDDEFKNNEEAYWQKREKLQTQIDDWMREYAETGTRIESQINAILAKPNFYQTLRSELFARVIHDHTIGLPVGPGGALEKVDFTSPDTKYELSDELTNALQRFIWDKIKKKTSGKKKSGR